MYQIFTDGGSRGNPGKAAIGVVIKTPKGVKEYGEYIGITTNNVAEYRAVIFALKKMKQLIGSKQAKRQRVRLFVDSELIERQLNGRYKILDSDLQPLFLEVWNLRLDFGSLEVTHITRDKNKKADAMVNKALDNANIQQQKLPEIVF